MNSKNNDDINALKNSPITILSDEALSDEELSYVIGGENTAPGVVLVTGRSLGNVCSKCGQDCWEYVSCFHAIYRYRCAACVASGIPAPEAGYVTTKLSPGAYPEVTVMI